MSNERVNKRSAFFHMTTQSKAFIGSLVAYRLLRQCAVGIKVHLHESIKSQTAEAATN